MTNHHRIAPRTTAMNFITRVSAMLFVILASAACSNPSTPAGYVGYVKREPMFFGKDSFQNTQVGPTSTGLGWRLTVQNVSVTPNTTTEAFNEDSAVLSHDNLRVAFQVHVLWNIRPDDVRDLVEKFSTLGESDSGKDKHDTVSEVAYNNFLKEPIRTFARDAVQKLDALQLKDNIDGLGATITGKAQEFTKGTPFNVTTVVIGNVQYPPEVADAVAKKLASTQVLEQKAIEIEIERRDAEKRVVQAEGIAKSMEIIRSKLNGAYLQHEAIDAQKAMVGSPNHTTIYIPVGRMGIPLVGTVDSDPTGASSSTK